MPRFWFNKIFELTIWNWFQPSVSVLMWANCFSEHPYRMERDKTHKFVPQTREQSNLFANGCTASPELRNGEKIHEVQLASIHVWNEEISLVMTVINWSHTHTHRSGDIQMSLKQQSGRKTSFSAVDVFF